MSKNPSLTLAFGTLMLTLGALAMGASVLFVRLADVGPFASAFWRVALALPPLALWAALSEGTRAFRPDRLSLLAGAFFAGDLFFWHLAILGTTVANATVLATTSPLWITAFAVLVLRQRVSRDGLIGLALCIAGALALVGRSWQFDPQHLPGDAAGLATAVFFAGYFLAVSRARASRGAAAITLVSTATTALILLAVALMAEPTLWPASAGGLAALVALALVSQVGGQGLMAVGLASVPPAFGALVFFLEVASAAALGALLLDEPITALQAAGGALILAGIVVARPRARPARAGEVGMETSGTGYREGRH
ncbi:drug/metabolite transporter (DMT)-like permease [Xanthobacter flavus]|uniref:Drug/metabolite transporter (DMT)-like permease n=1 Tax=Xanthobacter flavus TaxID=281 RepID=A0A9W6FHI1_XANFL|nr:DMT family transporter [Xanthobacter flavus]MDR6333683.1 drug/metabolite transporter (DMT)-like permease [Xanthobacter flavus]GLI20564.1 membrane protein [Xanthobacter flavus]